MENYPKGGEQEVVETQYSKVYYRLVDQLEKLKNKAEDQNLPEEERKRAQADLEELGPKFEEEFNRLDAMDKAERGKQAIRAAEIDAEDLTSSERKPDSKTDKIFVSENGLVGDDPSIKAASGRDNWVSNQE